MKATNLASSKRFTIKIFGRDWEIGFKKFNCREFLEPSEKYRISGRDRADHMLVFPLSPEDVGVVCSVKAFEELAMTFDNSRLMIELPGSTETMLVSDMQANALAEETDPDLGQYHSYHIYAMRNFGLSYSKLLVNHKAKLAVRFKAAFAGCSKLEPVSAFSPQMEAGSETIQALKALATEGHVYSEYLLGVLMAGKPGEEGRLCVERLINAHEMKQPEALAVLAEHLWTHGELTAAVQAALLSIAGGCKRVVQLLQKAGDTLDASQLANLHNDLERSGLGKLMVSRSMRPAGEAVGPQWASLINPPN